MIRFVIALLIMLGGSFLLDAAYGNVEYNFFMKIGAVMLYGIGFMLLSNRKAI